MVTTQFFGIKIARYLREHDISERILALVAEKAYRNGALNPNAWRREPIPADEIAAADMVNDPLTRLMFCSPGEGGAAIVLASDAVADRIGPRRCTCSVRPPGPGGSAPSRSSAPRSRGPAVRPASAPTPRPPPSRPRASLPTRSTSSSCRTPRAVPRSCTSPSAASARTASRRRWSPAGRPRSTAGCRSTPTAAASPTASRSAPPGCARCTRSSPSCAARPAHARSPDPRIGFTHVYGAPGISACTVLAV